MEHHEIKKKFDEVAQDYDGQRRGLIPCFDDFYGAAVAWTETPAEEPAVLDLGAGTGLLAAMLLDKYPNARMTLVDFSGDMLEQAKRRLAGYRGTVFIEADYTSYPFEGPFDAVVSSLSIHHLTHEEKRRLFRTVRRLLRPGGVFVNADQTAGASERVDERYRSLWIDAVIGSGLPREALDASIERRKLDRNAGLEDQLQWLRDAGFHAADCVYKYNEFTVYAAWT
jgi:Methylase involved in ubiquinone/menaquinone biosynthesis